jgi:hypothetical protein
LSTKTPARTWSALYQQRPAPEEGDFFKAEWLRPYDKMPARETLKIYGASDYAVTADGGDYTVHIVVGIDPEWRMYVLDLWREQASADKWIEAFCDLVQYWKPVGWAEEQGQIRAGVGPFLERRMRERAAYVARAQFPTRGDKRADRPELARALDACRKHKARLPWRRCWRLADCGTRATGWRREGWVALAWSWSSCFAAPGVISRRTS